MTGVLLAHRGTEKIDREALKLMPLPEATKTHQPVSHYQIVEALLETLSFRHIHAKREEYAVSRDGMKMFGVLDLETEFRGVCFSVGVRNANDKSMRLAMTVGYRVFVCDNMAFMGDFMPVFHKHTRKLDLIDVVSIGVDKIQRNFEPLRQQITNWQERELPNDQAKLIIYNAFFERGLAIPRHLVQVVHKNYFEPQHEAFRPRTMWSLSNAFTSSFKQLKPIPQFQASARLGGYLERFCQN